MIDTPAPEQPVLLTRAGLERLRDEVQGLREIKRPELLARLKRVSLFMDPAQGSALADVARSDLGALDRLIADNEAILEKARVIPDPPESTVELGSTVTLRSGDGGKQTLTLVETTEADLAPGYLSIASPVGQALLGKGVEADVTVGTGEDSVSLSVVAIGKSDTSIDPTGTERS